MTFPHENYTIYGSGTTHDKNATCVVNKYSNLLEITDHTSPKAHG